MFCLRMHVSSYQLGRTQLAHGSSLRKGSESCGTKGLWQFRVLGLTTTQKPAASAVKGLCGPKGHSTFLASLTILQLNSPQTLPAIILKACVQLPLPRRAGLLGTTRVLGFSLRFVGSSLGSVDDAEASSLSFFCCVARPFHIQCRPYCASAVNPKPFNTLILVAPAVTTARAVAREHQGLRA